MLHPMGKCFVSLGFISFLLIPTLSAQYDGQGMPAVLDLKDQDRVANEWLKLRLETVLPEIMRREKVDMWVVISRENNEDPVFQSLTGSAVARRLVMLVFFDRGKDGIERLSLAPYGYGDLYKNHWERNDADQWRWLEQVIKERDPKVIGINESEDSGLGDGLTVSLKKKLVEAIGPRFASHLRSADRVASGWLETRTPEELEFYSQIAAISHRIVAEAFSRQVMTPGVTTTEDVGWWMRERIRGLGLSLSFPPEITLIRCGEDDPKDKVIRPGDIVHCDMGVSCMQLCTDIQETAYVVKDGETEAPKGVADALAQGNRVQDLFIAEFKERRTGNEILKESLKKSKEQGLRAMIFTHPVGYQVHSAGPIIGLSNNQDGVPIRGDYPLFRNTCYAIELRVVANIPEWNNQEIKLVLEEDGVFDGTKVRFLDGRQTKIRLIR